MKTVRFADVVETSGRPEVYVSLVGPAKDAQLRRAVREQRVLTVHQQVKGHAADHGEVGLAGDPVAGEILVFPRSLRRFAGHRVIGIKYELLANTPKLRPAKAPAVSRRRPRARKSTATSGAHERGTTSSGKATGRGKRARRATSGAGARRSGHASRRPAGTPDSDAVLREVARAVDELKAGRAAPAYERLSALVHGQRPRARA